MIFFSGCPQSRNRQTPTTVSTDGKSTWHRLCDLSCYPSVGAKIEIVPRDFKTGTFSSGSISEPVLWQHIIGSPMHIQWTTAQAKDTPVSQAIAVYIQQLKTTDNLTLQYWLDQGLTTGICNTLEKDDFRACLWTEDTALSPFSFE
jgi:hypothetical protein